MLALSPTKRLTEFLVNATNRGADASLEQLFEIFSLPQDESTLAKVMATGQFLDGLGLCLAPDLSKGELATARRVYPRDRGGALTPELAYLEIHDRECEDLERKTSLMYHHARAAASPSAALAELKSEEVIHSAMKTVAAFLTSRGGILYVGVDDDCKVLGIEFDFRLLGSDKQNEDGWELQFRNLVTGNFKDGDNVNDYIQLRFLTIDGKCVSRIEVGPRRKLSFLKHKNLYHLFRRQGNRTEEIAIDQIEEFLSLRSSGGL